MEQSSITGDATMIGKLTQLEWSWSEDASSSLATDELQALQNARLDAWLNAFAKQCLPKHLAQLSVTTESESAALARQAISPLDKCAVHQSEIVLAFWDKYVPQLGSAVLAAASTGRASPATTARAGKAAAHFMAALAQLISTQSFLRSVLRAAAGNGNRAPLLATLSSLWSLPARLANAIGALELRLVPHCVTHDALGGALAEALVHVLWAVTRESPVEGGGGGGTAAVSLLRLQEACVRARQSGWSSHLAGAAAAAFGRVLQDTPPQQASMAFMMQAHAAVSSCLWAGATRLQCEKAVLHLLHFPPASPLAPPLASSHPWCALPLHRGVGPPHRVLSVPGALSGTIKRTIPQRYILTAYAAQQWLLYCSAAQLPGGGVGESVPWEKAFDALALADVWSQPLSVAALDTDLQQSMTGLLAFLTRNAPSEHVLLGTPLGTSLMRGVQERLGAPNLRVKAAGMLIGSVLSRAAAAASKAVLGVQLPVLDWSPAVGPEVQSEQEKQQSKAAADAAAAEAFQYLHLPMGSLQAAGESVRRLGDAWLSPVLPTALPPPTPPTPLSPADGGASDVVAIRDNQQGKGGVLSRHSRPPAPRGGGAVVVFEHDPSAKLPATAAPPAEFPDDSPRDEPAVMLGQPLPQVHGGGEGAGLPTAGGAMAFALRMAQVTQRDKSTPGSKEEASVAASASGVHTADGYVRATAPSQAGGQQTALTAEAAGTHTASRRPTVASNVPAAKYGQLPAPPTHLREVMKTLRDPPDYKHYISALAAVGSLVRALGGHPSTAHEIHDTAVPLLRVLLGANNQFGLTEFADWQQDALVAVTECSPILGAQWLTKVVFAQEQLLGVRIQVLHVLATAALSLANTLPSTSRGGARNGGGAVSSGDDAAVNALIEELVQHAGGTGPATPPLTAVSSGASRGGDQVTNGGRTRRWGVGAAKVRQRGTAATRVNAFAGVAGEFMLPLLRRVMDPSCGVNVLGVDGAEMLAALCRTLALMLEAAGSAPNISTLCGEVLHFVRVVHTHDSSGVRVGALCVVLACAEIVHRLQLQSHSMPPAPSSFLAAAVGGGVGHDADLMRSALGEAGSVVGLSAPAGAATAAVTRRLHGARTLLSAMAQRSAMGAGSAAGAAASQGEALQELAAWVGLVASHDPDAECRALAQRVASTAALQALARTQSTMVSLLEMMEM